MPYCFAPGCNHVSRRETCRFFRFPANEQVFKKWETLCPRKDRRPNREDRLCSCHFSDENDTFPSIFPHTSNKTNKRLKKKKCSRLPTKQRDIERADICSTCLSQGRSLKALSSLTGAQTLECLYKDFLPSSSMLCWECVADLRRIDRFRRRAQKAQHILQLKMLGLNRAPKASLSTLKTTKVHLRYIFTKTEIVDKHTIKHSIVDNFEDTDSCDSLATDSETDFHTNETFHRNETKFHTNETNFHINEQDHKIKVEIDIHNTENNFEDTNNCESSTSNFHTNEADHTKCEIKAETDDIHDSIHQNLSVIYKKTEHTTIGKKVTHDTNFKNEIVSNIVAKNPQIVTKIVDTNSDPNLKRIITFVKCGNSNPKLIHYKSSNSMMSSQKTVTNPSNTPRVFASTSNRPRVFASLSNRPRISVGSSNASIGPRFNAAPSNGPRVFSSLSNSPKMYVSSTSGLRIYAGPSNNPRVYASNSTNIPRLNAGPSNDPKINAGPSNDPKIYAGPSNGPIGFASPSNSTRIYASSTNNPRIGKNNATITIIGAKVSNTSSGVSKISINDPNIGANIKVRGFKGPKGPYTKGPHAKTPNANAPNVKEPNANAPNVKASNAKGKSSKGHLRQHMRKKHYIDPHPKQRVKDQLCPYCGKAFYEQGTLKSHIRTHMEKAYHCAHCEWKFSVRTTLVTHLWLKHPQYINRNVVKRSIYTKNTEVKRIRKKFDKKIRKRH